MVIDTVISRALLAGTLTDDGAEMATAPVASSLAKRKLESTEKVAASLAKFSIRSRRVSVIGAATSRAPNDSAADCVSRFHATAVRPMARSTRSSPAPTREIGASWPGSSALLV